MKTISKNQVKWVRSLHDKKTRDNEGVFIACGSKCVSDLLPHFTVKMLITSEEDVEDENTLFCTSTQLRQMTGMETPQRVVAVLHKPKFPLPNLSNLANKELCICLDAVQDPGNVGTIIRIADWFGVNHVFLGHGCADSWSPKTVSATMGSLARVNIHEIDLYATLSKLSHEIPIYGTMLDGDNIYQQELDTHGIILMGNEGRGIASELRPLINHSLRIPSWPPQADTADSLNVAMATAITLAEFRRKMGCF